MIFQRYLARQLSQPTGIIGKFVLGPLWNKRNATLNEVTLVHLEPQEEDRILDIGFGGGYLLERVIPKVKRGLAAGLDVSSVLVENCRARYRKDIKAGRVDIQWGRAEALPYPDRYFTKVSSVNSLFYWSDAPQGVAEIYRILQEKGKLVLTYTCKRDLEKKGFVRYGIKTYEEAEVRQMLAKAGFREIKAIRSGDRHREFICMTGCK
ncbi:MAG: methyltransferase domain-containing protein [Anaerolineales bacterium]|nr:methyltransferase domain-containing protein [Anaerolineales bacterium]